MGAPDAPAQLVQLGQAQLVGAVDDDGIGARHVDAGLDDGRAHQQVEAAVVEVAHDPLQVALAHLAVGDLYAGLGHQGLDLLRRVLDGLDLVVQEVDLSAAVDLALAGLLDQRVAPGRDEGLDRMALHRRGGDDGEIAHAGHRHVQRARDRRGGQRQHVHLGAQILQLLLVTDAEAMLLVDDRKPQVLELRRALQELVRADDDVDGAVGEPVQDGLGFLLALEP